MPRRSLGALPLLLLACLAPPTLGALSSTTGIDPANLANYQHAEFTCFDGSQKLPISVINDDYCDCQDGSDEPGTSACSNGVFYCQNKGHESKTVYSSHVNDGICDCCDGSDEYSGVVKCEDRCMEEGKEKRNDLMKFIESQEKGLAKRGQYTAAADAMRLEAQNRKAELDTLLAEKDALISDTNSKMADLEKLVDEEKEARRQLDEANAAAKAEAEQRENEARNLQAADDGSGGLEAQAAAPGEGGRGEGGVDGEVPTFAEEEGGAGEAAAPAAPPTPEPEKSVNEQELIRLRNENNENEAARKGLDSEREDQISIIEADYSPDGAFLALKDKCYSAHIQQYTYEVCMFKSAAQKEGTSSSNLGTWGEWGSGDDKYSVMRYTDGGGCWQGPARTMKVSLLCGEDDYLVSVAEPSKCVYEAEFMTPLACSAEMAQAAKEQLASMTGHH